MKKAILLSVFLLSLGFASQAVAQGSSFVPLAPIPGLTEAGAADPARFGTFFNNLYKYAVGLSAALGQQL